MRPINGTVVHIHHNLLAQQLLVTVPKNRIAVHGHTSIPRRKDQRIANPLHIGTEKTHLIISPGFSIHGIRIKEECIELQRIGMHKKAVALRIVHRHRTIGCYGIFGQFIVIAVVTCEHILVDSIRTSKQDINDDGADEIFIYGASDTIFAFDGYLQSIDGFPVEGNTCPQFADFDGDKKAEMFTFDFLGKLHGYDFNF